MDSAAVRCAVLPPVPVPYREPLFARLAERGRLDPTVIYQSGRQPGWDQRPDWFPERHAYHSVVLRSWQRRRLGRTPVVVPRGLGRALSELDPACVVSWEYGPATLRSLVWCGRRRRPLVIFSELTPASERDLPSPQLRLHRLLARRATGFVAASSGARERLLAMGIPSKRIEVSLQSADVARFSQRRDPGRRDGPVRVLSVGRLVSDKNVRALLEAFAEAGLRKDEAELEICGTGPLERELRQEARRLGVPARFLGYVEPAALPERYEAADVLALVSTYEPFGVAVREAVAAGLPLLCTRVAGAVGDFAREGENALLVDPVSRAEVAAALGRLVREPRLRERMAAASRALAEATPPEADVEAFERAVLKAVGRAPPQSAASVRRGGR
jgi:glycosyltransferase involved in cell wall biosynthesis